MTTSLFEIIPKELREVISYQLSYDKVTMMCSSEDSWKILCNDSVFWKRMALHRFGIPLDKYDKYYQIFVDHPKATDSVGQDFDARKMSIPEKYLWTIRKAMMYEYLVKSVPENLKEIQEYSFESYGGYKTHSEYVENLLVFVSNLNDDHLSNIEFARDVIVPEVTILDLEDMVEKNVDRIAVIFWKSELDGITFNYNIMLLHNTNNVYPSDDQIYPKSSLPHLYLKTVNLSKSIDGIKYDFDRRAYRQNDDLGFGYSSIGKLKKYQAEYLKTASEDQLDKLKMIIQIMDKLVNVHFMNFTDYDEGFPSHGVLISIASGSGDDGQIFSVPHLVIYNKR